MAFNWHNHSIAKIILAWQPDQPLIKVDKLPFLTTGEVLKVGELVSQRFHSIQDLSWNDLTWHHQSQIHYGLGPVRRCNDIARLKLSNAKVSKIYHSDVSVASGGPLTEYLSFTAFDCWVRPTTGSFWKGGNCVERCFFIIPFVRRRRRCKQCDQ